MFYISDKLLHKLVFSSMQGKDPKMMVICWDSSQLLSVFRDVFPENNDFLCASDHLIITTCIKKLILKYDGFQIEGKSLQEVYSDLREFLKSNIDYLLSIKQSAIDDLTKLDSEYVMEVYCPYQKLKSIIYTDQNHPGQSLICMKDTDDIPNAETPNLSILEVLHCPHIAVHIVFPDFEMFRQNIPLSEYKLIHFTSDYRPNVKQRNQKLKYKKPPAGSKNRCFSYFLIEYISQLINSIEISNEINESKKNDMLSIFKEFKTDFSLCTDTIDVDTEYYSPLANQSYVRYMGQRRSKTNYLSSGVNQVKVEARKEMRLQEIINPTIKFALKKFNVKYSNSIDRNNTIYTFQLQDKLNKCDWLLFSCVMCDVQFKGFLAKYEMSQHLINQHGKEPDWFCPKCDKSFVAKDLSVQRWKHTCRK